jgi:hypothetical protein
VRKAGGVCIADEVLPDIVTMAKVISYSDVQACPLDPGKKKYYMFRC